MIYILKPQLDLSISDESWYASLIEFPGWKNVGFRNPALNFTDQLPTPIEFVGDLDLLSRTDFPPVSPTLPMVSVRLLSALRAAGDFPFRTYPTRIYSNTIEDLVKHSSNSTRTAYRVDDPSLYTERFVILQLLDFANVLDTRRTLYADVGQRPPVIRRGDDVDNDWGLLSSEQIERLVITREQAALPGVFMFPQLLRWMCSDQTVQSCYDAGITGVEFDHLPQPLASGVRQIIGGFRYFTDEQLDQVAD